MVSLCGFVCRRLRCAVRTGPLRIFDLAVVLYQLLWLVRQFLAQMFCVFARDKIHVVQ